MIKPTGHMLFRERCAKDSCEFVHRILSTCGPKHCDTDRLLLLINEGYICRVHANEFPRSTLSVNGASEAAVIVESDFAILLFQSPEV